MTDYNNNNEINNIEDNDNINSSSEDTNSYNSLSIEIPPIPKPILIRQNAIFKYLDSDEESNIPSNR